LAEEIKNGDLLAPLWPTPEGIMLVDQTRLPFDRHTFLIKSSNEMAQAIKEMRIRGSGAIGCAGAMGAYLIVHSAPENPETWDELAAPLRQARPTALILTRAIDEVLNVARHDIDPLTAAAAAAVAFFENQLVWEKELGRHGAEIVPDNATILTHCHSGALAGAGYGGRALSVIRATFESGKNIQVISQETRPYLQGARITAWELTQLGIPVTLVTDGMSGALMQMGKVDLCVVGSDRIAGNGDLANKTGTYLIALAAREHGIPFYTATTRYNIDPAAISGKEIHIELRTPDEVLTYNQQPITVSGVEGLYPAFDITPAALLTGIITEKGILRPPYPEALKEYLQDFPGL
jgi:methylthioribose-1-phosphate isomerase